jgi:outer membrane lipoprotein SlyB
MNEQAMREHDMKNQASRYFAIAIAATAMLTGCGSTSQQNPAGGATSATQSGPLYGVVESVQPAPAQHRGPGVGAIAGGVVGGVLGHQVGGGSGNTAATAAGAIGGAVVGNEVEQRRRSSTGAWQVGVRLDNGGYQTVVQDDASNIAVGNRVRIENGRATPY